MTRSEALLVKAIDSALGADRTRKGRKPFVRPAIRGHDDGPRAIPLEQEVVEVATLGRVEDINRKVVENEEIDRDAFPQLSVVTGDRSAERQGQALWGASIGAAVVPSKGRVGQDPARRVAGRVPALRGRA